MILSCPKVIRCQKLSKSVILSLTLFSNLNKCCQSWSVLHIRNVGQRKVRRPYITLHINYRVYGWTNVKIYRWSVFRSYFLFDLISRVSSCRFVTGRYLPHHRRKASRYSNKPWTHQAIQSPDMECPPASFLPVISSHFQMSVFRWAAPSNNFVPGDNWKRKG